MRSIILTSILLLVSNGLLVSALAAHNLTDICSRPCTANDVRRLNQQVTNSMQYYFTNTNQCIYCDVEITGDKLKFLAFENGLKRERVKYVFENKNNCYIDRRGNHMAVLELQSCKTVFVNYECVPNGPPNIYFVISKNGVTSQCITAALEEMDKSGLHLSEAEVRACVTTLKNRLP